MTILIFIAIVLFIGGVNVGMFFYKFIQAQRIDQMQSHIDEIKAEVARHEQELAEALLAQRQLENLDRLLNNRMYWTLLYKKLGETTIPDVYFTEFDGSTQDRYIKVPGYARSYKALGQQILAWQENDQVEGVILDFANLQITEEFAAVHFEVRVRFAEEAWQED